MTKGVPSQRAFAKSCAGDTGRYARTGRDGRVIGSRAMDATCPFCRALIQSPRLAENAHAVAITDAYPISRGHSLILSRRHVEDLFDLSTEEATSLWALVPEVRRAIGTADSPAGFNIGVNVGAAAGQTVGHVHVHVIPRYLGDVKDPRGGVRWVIPERADYWSDRR